MIALALPGCLARRDSIVLVSHAVFSHTTNEREKVDCTNNNTYKALQSGYLAVVSYQS